MCNCGQGFILSCDCEQPFELNGDNAKIIFFKKLSPKAKLPEFKTDGAACADVYSIDEIIIAPNSTVVVKTGLAMQIPSGHCVIIRGRSGLSVNHNYHVKTGILDEDYRGEMGIIISNNSNNEELHIDKGDRIAQIMLVPVVQFKSKEVVELSETNRGTGGFGSTGSK